ncbi:hypothetical protein PH7735_04110 [Shimia thalassica]|uniref:Uncharacterized protein n=1 Tax=Shimia thalassica TaxID=1715693 RepID=A0A0P1IZS7_9RHOB|nr:hypothetical protein PH7735_04110 [Shimia thalassica]
MAVEFEEHFDLAVLVRFANRLQADFQRLAGVDFRSDLFAGLHAVKEGPRRQGPHRPIGPVAAHVIKEHLGIHQIPVQILAIDLFAFQLCRQILVGGLEVDRREMCAGTGGVGRFALEHLVQNAGRETTRRLAQIAAHHVDHTVGEGHVM